MSRKEYCYKCHKSVNGLYIRTNKHKSKPTLIRKAYYCMNCKLVLLDIEIVYKKTTFELL